VIALPALELRIPATRRCWKHELPCERPGGSRVFPGELLRHRRTAGSAEEPALEIDRDVADLHAERRNELMREQGHSILSALSGTDQDCVLRPLQVLHTQFQAFVNPQAGSVDQPGHQSRHALHRGQNLPHFVAIEDGRQASRPLGADQVVEPAERRPEHFFVKEDDGTERLRVSQGGDIRSDQRVQEALHVLLAEQRRMPLAVKQDVTASPVNVGLCGARTVVAAPAAPGDLLEKAGRAVGLGGHGHLASGREVAKCRTRRCQND